MRRLACYTLNVLTGLSLLLGVAIASFVIAVSFGGARMPFSWGGARWEAKLRQGTLSLNNEPQRREEEARYEALRRAALAGLVWGTPPHKRAAKAFDEFWEGRGVVATPAVDRRVRVLPCFVGTMVLPAVWVARRPTQRRWFVRRLPHAAAGLSLALCLGTAFMWVRGRRAGDLVTVAPYHVYQAVFGQGGVEVALMRVERVESRVEYVEGSAPARRPGFRPVGEAVVTRIDYADSEYAGIRRSRSPARGWATGDWEWQALGPVVRAGGPRTAPPDAGWLPRVTGSSTGLIAHIDGTGSHRQRVEERAVGTRVWLPYWLVVVMTSLMPSWVAWRHFGSRRMARRLRLNLCACCGYDLRATPDRCPECGAVSAAASAATPRV